MTSLNFDEATWSRLNKLLDEALELPPPRREEWLEKLSPELAGLAPQLREILSRAASLETDDFLRTIPRFEVSGGDRDSRADLAAGGNVGPYRLLRELGSGGMGIVWLAERSDGLMNRPVALKLPYLTGQHPGLAERMARERAILGTLDHRHIARLLDAGVTDTGQPYLALEYVQGVPIDRYCAQLEESAAGLRARLQLFRQVTDAVSHAHARLVLHRDLKPANILVTPDDGVKLLDFGIAKLLQDGAATATHLTQLSGRALTPEYASPEQIEGRPLTVSSDVYSLAVLLFEMLTGQRPYKLKRDSRGALEDAIVQMEAPRASSMAPTHLQRLLRGDLDNILAKGLRKEPAARYATVDEFAADVGRHLELRPILARADSRWYRTRRFVARNLLGVGAASAVVVALIGGAAVAWTQRSAALAEKARAEAVRDLVAGIFEIERPNVDSGRPLPATELLKQAASMVASSPSDDPLVRAEITRILAKGMLNVGDMEGASTLALGAREAAMAHYPPDHREVVRARLLHCEVLRYRGSLDEMRVELDALLPIVESRARQMPDLLFEAHYLYANMEIDTGQFDSATRAAQRAFAVAEQYFGQLSSQYVDAVQTLAAVDLSAGRPADGLRHAEDGLSMALRLARENPLDKQVITGKVVKARALQATGQIAQAASELEEVTRDAALVYGADSLTVGFHLQNLVNLQLRLGRNLDALDSASRALRIFETFVQPGSFNEVAAQNGLAHALLATRRTAEALQLYQRVLPTAAKVFGPTHQNTRDTRAQIALARALGGDATIAGAEMDAILTEQASAQKPGSSRFRLNAGIVRRLQQRPSEAITLIEGALGPESTFRDDVERASARVELAVAREAAGYPDVSTEISESLAVLEAQGHGSTPSAALARTALSRWHAKNGRLTEAINLAARVDDFWKRYAPQSLEARDAARWRNSLGQ